MFDMMPKTKHLIGRIKYNHNEESRLQALLAHHTDAVIVALPAFCIDPVELESILEYDAVPRKVTNNNLVPGLTSAQLIGIYLPLDDTDLKICGGGTTTVVVSLWARIAFRG